jgi:hypothetical protein
LNRPSKLMRDLTDAAERADRCLTRLQGHQRLDCLRQDLIQELLAAYQKGIDDERVRQVEMRDKQPNTKRQAEILEYYLSFKTRHGYIPSYGQIARHFGLSQRATVAKHFAALRRQGFDIAPRG